MTVYLARHARTSWTGVRYCGRADPPLDAAGREEAARLAKWFRARSLVPPTIIASPQVRALQTARPIAEELVARIETDERLIEVDFGEVQGLTFQEVGERFPDLAPRILAGELEIDWPGGETAAQIRTRAAAFWRERVQTRAADVIVVGHGRMLAAIRGLVNGGGATLAPASVVMLEHVEFMPASDASTCGHPLAGGKVVCVICVQQRMCLDCGPTHICFRDCAPAGCRPGGCTRLLHDAVDA